MALGLQVVEFAYPKVQVIEIFESVLKAHHLAEPITQFFLFLLPRRKNVDSLV